MSRDGRRFFIMGHPEYDRNTLRDEYNRDVRKGLDIQVPLNYFPDDDPTQRPNLQWRSHSNQSLLQLDQLLCLSGDAL